MDPLIIIFLSIAVLAAIFGVGYYTLLRKAKKEYDKAKDVVEDVVFSFNRQARQEAKKVETLAYKVEAISSKVDHAAEEVGKLGRSIGTVSETISSDSQTRELMLERIANVEKKATESAASHESLLAKVVALEAQGVKPRSVLDTGFEAVIPIKREKALGQLTDTEVSVLELLVSEGSKTAPEIKERVKLSREHTARLMKRLYEEGYLERETGKIPFRYTVKKEMASVLKKAETESV